MHNRVRPEDWRPTGIEEFERNAWQALRRDGSTLVVAGPGAGKTEFLAQRATYLLETGLCPDPFRILAISFKRDADENLRERVRSRCDESAAHRFDSMTFDAFTKGIVDRFGASLPENWRPTKPYDVETRPEIHGVLRQVLGEAPSDWRREIAGIESSAFEPRVVGSLRLPLGPIEPRLALDFAVKLWWRERLARDRSSLTFTCLNRLAELLIRTNKQLRQAVRITYPYVFVDEFQDTTYAQYDFLASVFSGSNSRITAVGDDKQRIMAWAGANVDAFEAFQRDFGAARIPLRQNHRSSPGLVRLQQAIAEAISAGSPEVESKALSEIGDDVAQTWNFATSQQEARHVADWLNLDMSVRETQPRDYALLVRQKADEFTDRLVNEFDQAGLKIRNESRLLGRISLQDLLADEATRIVLAILRLGAQVRAPDEWTMASNALNRLRAVDREDDDRHREVDDELTDYIIWIRDHMNGVPVPEAATNLADCTFEFLQPDAFRSTYARYATGDALEIAIEAFRLHFEACAIETQNWIDCLDRFVGQDSTPLMTVHKSKGLEYDTVLFLGLDDESWWSYSPGDIEGRSTFFVALSRAKQRVIFTYCRERRRTKIKELYGLLTDAGVPERVF